MHRRQMYAAIGFVSIGASIALSTGAQATPHRAVAAAKVPPGLANAYITAIVAVPHSSEVFAVATSGSVDNYKHVILRRSGNHWVKVKPPKLGGRVSGFADLAASSGKAVYLSGAVQAPDEQSLPALWHWNGHSFARVKLPALETGAVGAGQISLSSPTSGWVSGGMWDATDTQSTLHLVNGKWVAVEIPPETVVDEGMRSVAAVTAKFAWGLRADGAILYWSGTAWTLGPAVPAVPNLTLFQIAAAGKRAYVVGETENPTTGRYRPVIFKWTGKVWARQTLPKGTPSGALSYVAMSGRSVWAVGPHYGSNYHNAPIVLHSTGGGWSLQHIKGASDMTANTLAVASPKRAYLGGSVTFGSSGTGRTFIAQYNGHGWKLIPSNF